MCLRDSRPIQLTIFIFLTHTHTPTSLLRSEFCCSKQGKYCRMKFRTWMLSSWFEMNRLHRAHKAFQQNVHPHLSISIHSFPFTFVCATVYLLCVCVCSVHCVFVCDAPQRGTPKRNNLFAIDLCDRKIYKFIGHRTRVRAIHTHGVWNLTQYWNDCVSGGIALEHRCDANHILRK